ncbi:MAG: hypothetical protein P4L84_34930 [Isosphaeraceae bacterium]|nr:hypothetical protein [Isosphaeraceae bacterium]
MLNHRYRRPPKRWNATEWPFYRPGVNPVAPETPRRVLALAVTWLNLRDSNHPAAADALVQLERALEGPGRNRWHRVSDVLVGLWDERDRPTRLRIIPAFSRLYTRRFHR